MKFTTSSTPKKQTFDLAAAEEALGASVGRLYDAATALVDSSVECNQILEVAEDSMHAISVLKKQGVQHLGVCLAMFNGDDRALDRALHMESVATETLAHMDVKARTLIRDQYVSALEANVGQAFKEFWEKVKAWFANFVQWCKELFTGNAKLFKMVQETTTTLATLDESSTITAITYEDAKAIFAELMKNERTEFAEVEKHTTMKTATIKELGWTVERVRELGGKFRLLADSKTFKESVKACVDRMNRAIKESANGDQEKVDKLKKEYKEVTIMHGTFRRYDRAVRVLGMSLLRIAKRGRPEGALVPVTPNSTAVATR